MVPHGLYLDLTHASTRAPRLTFPVFRVIGASWVHVWALTVDAANMTSERSLMNMMEVRSVWCARCGMLRPRLVGSRVTRRRSRCW